MYTIFVTGTAGSGKSLLTSNLLEWYNSNDFTPISINLDPGVTNLPYNPDVDVRDFIDIYSIMENYNLGPNGSLILANFFSDNKVSLFTIDGTLAESPSNYVSLMFLSQSVKLRLNIPQINVLTKRDKIIDKLEEVLEWSNSISSLQDSLNKEKNLEQSLQSKDLIKTLLKNGHITNPIAISNITMNGMINLSASLSRIFTQGEEK